MALCIDSRYITGIYALGQWFKVKKDSVCVDAYNFTHWDEPSPHSGDEREIRHTDYMMGDLYEEPADASFYVPYGEGSKGRFSTPAGSTGISFVDADTGEQVSFSLMEVRAFREDRPKP